MKPKLYLTGWLILLLYSCNPDSGELSVYLPQQEDPRFQFAMASISEAILKKGHELAEVQNDANMVITMEMEPELGFESYRIRLEQNQITIAGGDRNGIMYGGLELAEIIRTGKSLHVALPVKGTPYIPHRGLRYNIPLDARTPSYDDTGDAAQKNIETVWEMDYWKAYLDQMARNRYNLLTLWSLHPYPSMVKVPEYPDVALEDVCVYNGEIDHETGMRWRGLDIQNPANLSVIKSMSIDEKIEFWKEVFQYADDRGIEVYLFHWNVFVNGAEGKHGIEWSQDNPVTVDYLRKSVKQFLLTYPNIKGIGVTAGEHINRELTGKYATENWMWLTYGQGVMDAKAEDPDLDVRFIFRRHWSDLDDIMNAFRNYDGKIETSFKYSRARMYSSAKPVWFDSIYRETVEKYGIPCWLNVRNDDILNFRWGDPAYARDYVKNMPRPLSPGFYMGPDGYVWGRVHNSKLKELQGTLETQKHWYRFMIWGRLAYNPDLPEEFFIEQIKMRFPGTDAELLYDTWKATSDIISLVDKVHFRQNDMQFLPAGCFDRNGFHDVNSFIGIGAMPGQNVASIAEYARSDGNAPGRSPFEMADQLEHAARKLLEGSRAVDPGENPELKETLGDFRSLGFLGKYYAAKIRGATCLAMYRVAGREEDKETAIQHLEQAVEEWEAYAASADEFYTPQLMARTRLLDWDAQLEHVKMDVEIAKHAQPGEEVRVTDDNKLWNRDERRF